MKNRKFRFGLILLFAAFSAAALFFLPPWDPGRLAAAGSKTGRSPDTGRSTASDSPTPPAGTAKNRTPSPAAPASSPPSTNPSLAAASPRAGTSPGSRAANFFPAAKERAKRTGPDYVGQDAGLPRNFVLALDEMWLADADGKGRVVSTGAASPQQLEQLLLASSSGGHPARAVLYEDGAERNEFTRRVVTPLVTVQLSPNADPSAVAELAGASSYELPAFAPGFAVLRTGPALDSLRAAEKLSGQPGVLFAEAQLARQHSKRAMPNDPLISRQWHLKFASQSGAVSGTDVNIENAWAYPTAGAGRRGRGIYVGVVDDGLETAHPDLAANVDTAIDKDWNDSTPDDPNPGADDDHGTACAGNVAAVGNNGVGVSGTAPEAKLVGMRLISNIVDDSAEAEAMTYRSTGTAPIIHILSNSWGPADNGSTLEGPGPLAAAALKTAAETGRGGKGTIITWAGGNGLDANDDSNYDGYANSIYTIAVGAFDSQSSQAWYSEPGANLVITAPSSGDAPALGITTVDRSGSVGYNSGSTAGEISGQPNYTQTFGGTSSSTPTVSGIIALMLEANPNLGWRDVQEILMRTAKKVNPTDTGWKTPVAPDNINHNHKFGAGLVDATAAVNMAGTWVNLPAQLTRSVPQTGLSVAIPDNNVTGTTRQFTVAPSENLRVEHVRLVVSITHSRRRQLRVELTSPSGTTSVLATHASTITTGSNFTSWPFMTVRNWGENSAGTWTLRVSDPVGGTVGTLTAATLEVYGSSTVPINPPPSVSLTSPNDGVVFTPGSTIELAATAADLDGNGNPGTVSTVEFWANGNVVGSDETAPYSFSWTPAVGNYAITARAVDSEGASSTSAAVNVQVRNQTPTITSATLSPTGEVFSDTAVTVSSVAASDADGDPIGYAYQWQSSANGAVYTDAAGLTGNTLPPAPDRSGLLWRCRITPSDAGGSGTPFFTAAVALNRRPPSTATVGQAFSYDSDLFLRGSETSFVRKAILSEFSQGPSRGTAEWVEFLVLKAGSLRGWKLQDAAGGTVTLADVAAWDNIPAGTLVVIYNGASKDPLLPADDLSPGADNKMIVSSADTTMCTGVWPSLSSNGDGILLRDASNAILSQVGYGSGVTITPNIGAVSGGKSANYRGNTEDGGLVAANWSIESATTARSVKALLPGVVLSGGSYSQSFNSTPGANGTAYPDGWTSYDGSTEDAVMTVGTAASPAGANYNYGSRIGLLGSGNAFENSSVVLAIANTTGQSNLIISYRVIKVREQSRSHDFNLEYSLTSPTSGFVAVPGGSYTSGTIPEGTVTSFASIALPAAVSNQGSRVYLRWVYKPSATPGSGSRDGLALDDVVISSGPPSPSLALAVSPSSFAENAGASAATGTVTLNQTQAQDLVVNLVSSDTAEAAVPASVTIPAGQLSARFAVAAVDDEVSDGSVSVTITATAGVLSATASVTVTDNEVSLNGVTPGAPNGGDNTIWVGLLRSGALNQPALFRLGTGNPSWLSINATTGLLSGTPDSQGISTITLERYNSLGETALQTFQVTIGGNVSGGFSDWVLQFPGLPDTAPGADPDGDGLPNLVEYFMGLSPADAVVPGEAMVLDAVEPDEVHLDYRRSKSLNGVTGGVAWRNDLTSGAWSSSNVTDVALEDHGTYEIRRATVPVVPGEDRKFLRLEVEQE